jgi:hypothetical protein
MTVFAAGVTADPGPFQADDRASSDFGALDRITAFLTVTFGRLKIA